MSLVRRTAPFLVATAVFGALSTPATADHAPQRGSGTLASKLTLRGTNINGSDETLTGHTAFRTPAAWRHVNRNGSRSQHFRAVATETCTARIHVSPRAEATRRSAQAQVDRAMRVRVGALLGSGRLGDGGRWALSIIDDSSGDPSAAPPAVDRRLYGIAVTPVRQRRFVHTRVLVVMSEGCTVGDVRSGTVQAAVKRLVRTAKVRARIS